MQHRPHCPLLNQPHQPPASPEHGETPPPHYEEIAERSHGVGRCPAGLAAGEHHQEEFGDPYLDQENLPPPGVLRYEETVGEWVLYPEFPPPNSSLFHRRLQARLAAELARCEQPAAVPADDPALPDRAPLQLLAAVHPLQPGMPDLRALEELPEEGDSGDTMPPPVPNNTPAAASEPMMVDPEEDLYVTADGDPATGPEQDSPSASDINNADPVSKMKYW